MISAQFQFNYYTCTVKYNGNYPKYNVTLSSLISESICKALNSFDLRAGRHSFDI